MFIKVKILARTEDGTEETVAVVNKNHIHLVVEGPQQAFREIYTAGDNNLRSPETLDEIEAKLHAAS